VLGGAVLQSIGGQYLGLVAAGLIAIAFLRAEAAHYCSRHPRVWRCAMIDRGGDSV
jgi:hypothetical protein